MCRLSDMEPDSVELYPEGPEEESELDEMFILAGKIDSKWES